MSRADTLVAVGVVIVAVALWLLADWPAALLWAGVLTILAGVAEARRK